MNILFHIMLMIMCVLIKNLIFILEIEGMVK